MHKKLILNSALLSITLNRLCQQFIEEHDVLKNTIIIGLQPRGIFFADFIHQKLEKITKEKIPLGYLDPTFYRDDFRRRDEPVQASETHLPSSIENKNILLVDDVLYTGRTVRAAMEAIVAFGRPSKIEFMVLIDRKNSRDLPITADYVGQSVNTIASQRVLVELTFKNHIKNKVWLIDRA